MDCMTSISNQCRRLDELLIASIISENDSLDHAKRKNLTLRDRLANALPPLSRGEMNRLAIDTVDSLWRLLDDLLTLGKDELNVAGVGHVRVDLQKCQRSNRFCAMEFELTLP